MSTGVSGRGRLRPLLVAVVVVTAAALLLRQPLARAAGRMLVVDEPIHPVDLIVVPEWTQAAGALEAADLVRNRIGDRVAVLADYPDRAEDELIRRGLSTRGANSWLVRLLHSLGVSNVEQLTGDDGTEAETAMLPRWCEQHQIGSLVVVSLTDHSRRMRRMLRRSARGHALTTIVRTSRYSAFDPNAWWLTHSGIRTQLQESGKLLLDVVSHPFS